MKIIKTTKGLVFHEKKTSQNSCIKGYAKDNIMNVMRIKSN